MERTGWATRASVGVALVALLSVPAPYAAADAPTCSFGDAAALFQALEPLGEYRFKHSLPPCQYRVWFDGEHYTFDEDDWFLAGIVIFWEYQQLGLTRAEGIAELEKFESRLWLTEIGPQGTPVEQSLMSTNYRNVSLPEFGVVVYRQDGVILHLPPGDYRSTFEGSFEGDVVLTAEVTLTVLAAS